jgi:hypothetical protein
MCCVAVRAQFGALRSDQDAFGRFEASGRQTEAQNAHLRDVGRSSEDGIEVECRYAATFGEGSEMTFSNAVFETRRVDFQDNFFHDSYPSLFLSTCE